MESNYDIVTLYVENDDETRKMFSGLLQRRIRTLYVAADGQEGLELFKLHKPDLIITDLRMPVMDGLAMSKEIRNLDQQVQIIMITAYVETDYLLNAIEIGINQYVLKPVNLTKLFDALEHCIKITLLEKRLKQQNVVIQNLYQAIEQSSSIIEILDENQNIEYTNPQAEKTTGYSLEELIGQKPIAMRAGLVSSELLEEMMSQVSQGGWRGEFKNQKKSGEFFWELVTITPVRDDQGHMTHYIIVKEDITDRKLMEEALQKAHEELEIRVTERTAQLLATNEKLQFEIAERKQAEEAALTALGQNQQLIATISSIVIGVSEDELVIEWNSAAEKAFNLPTAEVIGHPFKECNIGWNWNDILQRINHCVNGKLCKLDNIRYTRPDGREGLLGFSINRIGESKAYYLFGTDITDRKNIEAQAILSQKMVAIGQLAAGIAHEINTPTQYIGDNIRFLQTAFRDLTSLLEEYSQLHCANTRNVTSVDLTQQIEEMIKKIDLDYLLAEIPKAIEQSLEGNGRVAKIVKAMKDFAHPSQGKKMFSNINQALEGTIAISRNEWKYVADIETELDPELPMVNCVLDEINQVVLNMIVNAADAIKEVMNKGKSEKGKITIETKHDGEVVKIIIRDTGSGIPQSIIDKIFDPFFTTKEVGKGTGQGLTIAHDIVVNKHQGKLEVESEFGKGTIFIISLPIDLKP